MSTLPDIASMVMNDDALRPQSTFGYNKEYSMKPFDFPELYIDAPIAVMNRDPVSTRASLQNVMFAQRYFNK